MTLLLVRHGRTALNAAGALRGHLDPPLDEVGQAEARAVADVLGPCLPVRIVSSPLVRATQTAAPLARRLGLAVEQDRRLIDRDYGTWAGCAAEEVAHRFGHLDAAPGVEPAADVVARAVAVLDYQRPFLQPGRLFWWHTTR